jgi:hypothetical protein
MPIYRTAPLPRLLPLHSRDEQTIVIHQRQRTIAPDDDIVRFEVAVGEGLGDEPGGEGFEVLVPEPVQVGLIIQAALFLHVVAQGGAICPFHRDDGVFGTGGPDLVVQVVVVQEIVRLVGAEVRGYELVAFLPAFLEAGEALEGEEFAGTSGASS